MGDQDGILSAELLEQLGENIESGGSLLAERRKLTEEEKRERKLKPRFTLETLPAARPDNAVPSLKRSKRGAEEYHEVRKDSKRKKKALAKIEDDKRRKERRRELFASLSENQLTPQEQSLLVSSAAIGSKETLRDRLRMDLRRERAGIDNLEEELPTAVSNKKKKRSRGKKAKATNANDADNASGARLQVSATTIQESSDESDSDSEAETAPAILSTGKTTGETKDNADDKQDDKQKSEDKLSTTKNQTEDVVMASTSDDEDGDSEKKETTDEPKSPREENFVVRIKRTPEVEESRGKLPVSMMEQEIMEAISHNAVTVLCGETGSGKTTQVPQFLFEAGYGCKEAPNPELRGLIGVTQPRRVATVSMAERVANELGDHSKDVGYQIRYDSRTITSKTRVKFMTDGVLLREAREDLLLRKYSVIVLDEAHERNLNTDILLGLLSRVVPLRDEIFRDKSIPDVYPLRVIIMSATLRVDDFARNPRLFTTLSPPVVKVDARQFPVTTHFSRRTEMRNYLAATFKKTCAVHRRLPAGAVLVFLTGQREIEWMVTQLRNKFNGGKRNVPLSEQTHNKASNLISDKKEENSTPKTKKGENEEGKKQESKDGDVPEEDIDYSDIDSAESGDEEDEEDAALSDSDDDGENKSKKKEEAPPKVISTSANARIKAASARINSSRESDVAPVHVLPLYSRLPTAQQMEVFKEVPEGHRLIVVSTNVAETSVTIPGIRYVVDCGREKRKVHDQYSGTSKFEIGWISQASANQRMGRAGRTGPGHCYRLFSSAVFNDQFEAFGQPEIDRLPIEDVVLYMKTLGIENVESFPFPSAPETLAIQAAESRLVQLGALVKKKTKRKDIIRAAMSNMRTTITPLGRRMTHFPVRARLAKMLSIVACDTDQSLRRVAYVVCVVAALSLQEPFLHQQVIDEGKSSMKLGKEDESTGEDTGDNANKASTDDEKKRRLREEANKIKSRWFNDTSDVIGLLTAHGAYTHMALTQTTRQTDKFCKENFLHIKTMREQLQLRQQLASIVAKMRAAAMMNKDPDSDVEESDVDDDSDDEMESARTISNALRGSLQPPKAADLLYLRQVVTAGYLDQVARKMTRDEARSVADAYGFKLKKKRWPYMACSLGVNEPLFLSPHSNIMASGNDLPEFVVYGHVDAVEQTNLNTIPNDDDDDDEEDEKHKNVDNAPRDPLHYMRQVTAIDPAWLFELSKGTEQCSLSAVLEHPPPSYEAKRDELVACVHPLFGPRRWKLPVQWLKFPASTGEEVRERSRWFARALLEGKVLPIFKDFKDWYAVPTAYMTRKVQDVRVQLLQKALESGPRRGQPVISKRDLFRAWESKPQYLFTELQQWIVKEKRKEFRDMWQRILQS